MMTLDIVGLTSLVMTGFDQLVKREIIQRTQRSLDPLKFAYRLNEVQWQLIQISRNIC